jgi:hypothetical protein
MKIKYMEVGFITNVRHEQGIMWPHGEKYVPKSLQEYNWIYSKISSYSVTGSVGGNGKPHDTSLDSSFKFISFRYQDKPYYIDLLTLTSDLRQMNLEELDI